MTPSRPKRAPNNTSASQVKLYKDCARKWWFAYVLGLRGPSEPAQEFGTEVHRALEIYLKTGRVTDKTWSDFVKKVAYKGVEPADFVRAAMPHLPKPRGEFFVEMQMSIRGNGLPKPWKGVIDLLEPEPANQPDVPRITDHKTTSDFRYCLTPEELETDTQGISYAKRVLDFCDEVGVPRRPVEVRLLYLHTRRKKIQVNPVSVIVEPSWIEDRFAEDVEIVKEMYETAAIDKHGDVACNTNTCSAYGGCPYLTKCGLSVADVSKNRNKGASEMSSFLAKLRGEADKQKKGPAINPPDAAPDTNDEPEVEAAEEPEEPKPKKKKASTKKTKKTKTPEERVEAAKAKVEADAEKDSAKSSPAKSKSKSKKTPAKKADKAATFTLYINCMPQTGGDDVIMFETWITEIIEYVNEKFADDVADYRLLPYAQEKLAITEGCRHFLDRVPESLVIDNSHPVARDVLPVLIPNAGRVVRAFR